MVGKEIGVIAHAIAGALDLDNGGAIEQPGRNDGITKDVTPFSKAAVKPE